MRDFWRILAAVGVVGILIGAACTRPEAPREIAVDQRASESSPRADLPEDYNARFKDPALDVSRFVGRWEGESREIYRARRAIADAVELKPGMAVADIGAGTGLFTEIFAEAVGPGGEVYAVDIAPAFCDHIRERATAAGLPQIMVVQCAEDDVKLPPDSIDVAFVCDTYHHFEYPAATLASIRNALRPGGRLVVVDFERIPGQSREWVLNHVRAGQETFRAEIEAAGFALVNEPDIPGLEENYYLRFHR